MSLGKGCRPHPDVHIPRIIVTDRSRRRRQRDRKQIARSTEKKESRAERSQRHREQRRIARENIKPAQLDDGKAERRRQRCERRRQFRQRRRIAGRRVARHRERQKAIVKRGIPDSLQIGSITIQRIRPKKIQEALSYPIYKQIGHTIIRKTPIVRRHYTLRRRGVGRDKNQAMLPRPEPNDTGLGKLGSKKIFFQKKWYSNPMNVHADFDCENYQQIMARIIVWHRDIVAAKCILYVGKYTKHSLFFVLFQLQFQFVCFRPLSCIRKENPRIVPPTTRTDKTTNSTETAKTIMSNQDNRMLFSVNRVQQTKTKH